MSPAPPPGSGPPRPDRFVLELPARTGYLAVVRELVARAAVEHRFSPPEVAKTVMAVDEACVNIIEHAYADHERAGAPLIAIELQARPSQLEIIIGDRARSRFSPVESHPALPPDLETYWQSGQRRGLGLLILRSFMDAISHTFEAGRGNRLKLVKYNARLRKPT